MSVLPKIEITELVPKHTDEYITFFETIYRKDPWLNTKDNPWWGICYCGFYDDPRSENDRNNAPDAPLQNRKARAAMVSAGKAHGLLAYSDGRIVGWLNSGQRAQIVNLRGLAGPDPDEGDRQVGSILCFVVAEPYRGKGVATSLLEKACEKFRGDRLKIAEAYPRTAPPVGPYYVPKAHSNYRGSLEMFQRSGFKVHRQLERHAIVRKQL